MKKMNFDSVAGTFELNKNKKTEGYLTPKELQKYASISDSTLKKWKKMGMPYIQLDRCIRFNINEFDTWFNNFRSNANDKDQIERVWDSVVNEGV